jgi:plasmid stabilization system protein ParE
MTVYKVEIDQSVHEDVEELKRFLRSVMSREGAHRYIEALYGEMLSLSVFADCFGASRSQTIRAIHPHARRMVSRNRKYVYVFHIEEDVVVIDRILNAKMITR